MIGEGMRWATMATIVLVCIVVATWVHYDGV